MQIIFEDNIFNFPALGGGFGVCLVRVYSNKERSSALVLFVEDDRNFDSTSITNSAEVIAAKVNREVLELLAPNAAVRWVEIYANLLHPEPTFDWIEFEPRFNGVSWRVSSRAELEGIIGGTINGIPDGDERHPQHAPQPG